jgi:hypothetical protein
LDLVSHEAAPADVKTETENETTKKTRTDDKETGSGTVYVEFQDGA